jgi:arylsulfatase A-like enzyme
VAPGSAGPFRGRKRDLWEGGIRVPCLLEWPAVVKQPRVVHVPCVTTDFLPTLTDFLGLDDRSLKPLDGLSLRPLIEGNLTGRPAPIGFEFGNMAAWLDNRYKLVALLTGGGPERDEDGKPADPAEKTAARPGGVKSVVGLWLYDIPADPREETDLAAEKPELVKSMSAALDAWRRSCRQSLDRMGD